MHKIFIELIDGLEFAGNIEKDPRSLLAKYNCIDTAEHSEFIIKEKTVKIISEC